MVVSIILFYNNYSYNHFRLPTIFVARTIYIVTVIIIIAIIIIIIVIYN